MPYKIAFNRGISLLHLKATQKTGFHALSKITGSKIMPIKEETVNKFLKSYHQKQINTFIIKNRIKEICQIMALSITKSIRPIMRDFTNLDRTDKNIYTKIREGVVEIIFKVLRTTIKDKSLNKPTLRKWKKSKKAYIVTTKPRYSTMKLFHGRKPNLYLFFRSKKLK